MTAQATAGGGTAGRRHWIDLLTVVSSIGVVFLHCNLQFWNRPAGAVGWLSNAIECVFYCCVPVFFMVSGYTLMDFRKRYGTAEFLRRRFLRAAVPFLFWSAVAWKVMGVGGGVKGLLLSTANTSAMPIYWFFPPLFGCYVAMLALSHVRNKVRLFTLLAGILFLSNSVLPFCEKLFHPGVSSVWKWPLGPEQVLFVLLGYALGHARLDGRARAVVYALGAVGFCVHFFGTWRVSPVGGPINMLFKGYMNWPSVLYAAAVFTAAAHVDWDGFLSRKVPAAVLGRLKDASLAIYLLHGFFIYWLFPKHLPRLLGPDYGASAAYRLLMPLALVAFCVAVNEVVRRIPVVRRLLG